TGRRATRPPPGQATGLVFSLLRGRGLGRPSPLRIDDGAEEETEDHPQRQAVQEDAAEGAQRRAQQDPLPWLVGFVRCLHGLPRLASDAAAQARPARDLNPRRGQPPSTASCSADTTPPRTSQATAATLAATVNQNA